MNQMIRTLAQNKQLHTLLALIKSDTEMKAGLVLQFTHNRTSKSSDMNYYECDAMIKHLQSVTGDKSRQVTHSGDTMRKKIISIWHLLGGYQHEQQNAELPLRLLNGKPMIDYQRIDRFCITRGSQHKPFTEYSVKELPTLITQFERVLEHHLNPKTEHEKS